MGIDRYKEPNTSDIYSISYPKVEILKASNGIDVHVLRSDTENVIKIDLVFLAGTRFAHPLVAQAAADLMTEATKHQNSETLSNIIESNGAYLYTDIHRDRVTLSLVVLERFFDNVIKTFCDVITSAAYDNSDIDNYITIQKQHLIYSLENSSTLANKRFSEMLFGEESPYGKVIKPADYDTLQRKQICEFYRKHYTAEGCYAVVSGNFSDQTFRHIMAVIESVRSGKEIENNPIILALPKARENILKPEVQQASIKLGELAINCTHADYHLFKIANTILGGYFGSRLMQVIREQKGLTYGIGSAVISLEQYGYWTIAGNVLLDKVEEVLQDINEQIEILKNTLIDEQELRMIKNYMQGDLLQHFDGIFSTSDTYKSLLGFGLDLSYYQQFHEQLLRVTAKEIRQTVNQYFHFEKATTVVINNN